MVGRHRLTSEENATQKRIAKERAYAQLEANVKAARKPKPVVQPPPKLSGYERMVRAYDNFIGVLGGNKKKKDGK